MSVEIRKATTQDVEAVLTFWEHAGGPTALVDEADDVRRLIATPASSLLIADDNGELVGSVVAGWDGWRGNLYRVAVAPQRRGHGLGTRLVRAAEAALVANGCPRVTALVHLELGDAAPFWKKVGYAHDTEVGRFVRNL